MKVFVVAHTHWDREWYETHQNFRYRLVQAVDRLLDIFAGDPRYAHFLLDAQAIVLRDYLEIRPEKRVTLQRLVEEGRLEIGPWYVLADEFLVSGEALIRNLQLGMDWCQRFARTMRIGYIPDSFGHPGQLPQILRGFGLEVAVASRGLEAQEAELWWQAPDGSRVLVLHLRQGYGNLAWVPLRPDRFLATFEARLDALRPYVHSGAAILLAGTDHLEPLPQLPDLLEVARAAHPELEIEHTSLSACAAWIQEHVDGLATVRGEQRAARRAPVVPGTLSSRMHLKQRNDACQRLLERCAEPLSGLARALGGPDWRPHLRHAWEMLLENHPHDSISGCSVDAVHREMLPRFERVEQLGERVAFEALTYLGAQVDTSGVDPDWRSPGRQTLRLRPLPQRLPVVVFNPSPTERTDLVRLRVPLPDVPSRLQVLDARGRALPYRWLERPRPVRFRQRLSGEELRSLLQQARSGDLFNRRIQDLVLRIRGRRASVELIQQFGEAPPPLDAIHAFLDRVEAEAPLHRVAEARLTATLAGEGEIEFLARELPPLGVAVFVLAPGAGPSWVGASGPGVLENEFLRLEADASSGTFTLADKRSGRTFEGLNRFLDGGDAGDLYNYSPPAEDLIVDRPERPASVRRRGHELEMRLAYRLPAGLTADRRRRRRSMVRLPITVRASLPPGRPWVEVEVSLENRIHDHRLQVAFPTPFAPDKGVSESCFDVVERPVGVPAAPPEWPEDPAPEFPQAGWSALESSEADGSGLMVANLGLPEMAFVEDRGGAQMVLTLLRCTGQISRGDLRTRRYYAGPPHATPEGQCPGSYTFRYALIPYTDGWQAAAPQADLFRHPPRAVITGWHEGRLPSGHSFLSLPAALALSALKPAWSSERLVLRVWSRGSSGLRPPDTLAGLPLGQGERLDLAETAQAAPAGAALAGAEVRTLGFPWRNLT